MNKSIIISVILLLSYSIGLLCNAGEPATPAQIEYCKNQCKDLNICNGGNCSCEKICNDNDTDNSSLPKTVNCDNGANDAGIQALCLYAEQASLAGHGTANPLRLRAACDYAQARDHTAEMLFEVGGIGAYFDPRIKLIHKCYTQKKRINVCAALRAD